MKETKDPRRAGKSGQPTVHKDHATIVLQIGVPRVNFSRCDDDHENVQNDQNCNRYCKGVQNHLWLRYVAGVRGVSVVIVMEPKRTYQHIHRNHRKRDQETVEGCLLYTSDAADDMQCVDLGGRRIIKKV